MNTKALTDAVAALSVAVNALPAQIVAENAVNQQAVDDATTAINAAATAIAAIAPTPVTPAV